MTKRKTFIIVMGPQGSGKSTQASLLADYIGYKFISSGKYLRKLEREENPIGLKLSEFWKRGEFVPDDVINDVMFSLFEKEESSGFVIDGYPRNHSQLKTFLSYLNINNWELRAVIYLEISEAECLVRISNRAKIEMRIDESIESVKKRLSLYHEETEPLVAEYNSLGVLKKIDAERTIEEIQQNIQFALGV